MNQKPVCRHPRFVLEPNVLGVTVDVELQR